MALDLTQIVLQLDSVLPDIKKLQADRRQWLYNACATLKTFDVDEYEVLRQTHERSLNYPIVAITRSPDVVYDPPPLPSDFSVVSTDGSHIDVDRHSIANVYVINVGTVLLTYGSKSDAVFEAKASLYGRKEDLVLSDEIGGGTERVEGPVLAAKRAVAEIEALTIALEKLPEAMPTVAMVDGSLAYIGLRRGVYQDFVFRSILEDGFVAALRKMQLIKRKLAVVGYISLPNSAEVVGALRLASCGRGANQSSQCNNQNSDWQPCSQCLGDLRDRDVFGEILSPGQRSEVFELSSELMTQYYGDQTVRFFYLNIGTEVVRVEIPQWVAEDDALLGLAHAVTLQQCLRNMGYPAAIMEAHEQAVISVGDRRAWSEILTGALERDNLPVVSSEKDRSKRIRWL